MSYAGSWADYRRRRLGLWLALLGYPALGILAAAVLLAPGQGPWGIVLFLGWPLAISAAALWWKAWPCPRCGHAFFRERRPAKHSIFSVPACSTCGLGKWEEAGAALPDAPAARVDVAAGAGSGSRGCWFCGRRKAAGPTLALDAFASDDPKDQRQLRIPRCRSCAVVHELDRGLGGAAAGLLAFLAVGALFIRGVDPAAGFGPALARLVPFAGLAFVAVAAAIPVGLLASRPRLWGSRPKADWNAHPDVARLRDEGFAVTLFEAELGID